jgi:hypothetical protein
LALNATFNNISVISWQSVLLVEETGVPGEKHWPVAYLLTNLIIKCWIYKFYIWQNIIFTTIQYNFIVIVFVRKSISKYWWTRNLFHHCNDSSMFVCFVFILHILVLFELSNYIDWINFLFYTMVIDQNISFLVPGWYRGNQSETITVGADVKGHHWK